MGLFKKDAPPVDERLQALTAEFQNYRRRTEQQLLDADTQALKKAVLEFLPLYDDLTLALSHTCQDEAFYHGIELIRQKLLSILASMQVQPMDSLGKCFNPDYHEAVEHIEDSEHREEEIVAVLRTGFTMDEEVIRHAKVIVAN